jgi:hypothetical protein
MDRARQSVQGNSKTARQLAEMYGTAAGLYGGSAGIGIYGAYNQDPTQVTIGALAGALTHGRGRVNQNVMRNVADILTSQDPTRLMRDRIARAAAPNPAALANTTNRALAAIGASAQTSEQRSALARRLRSGIIGGVVPQGTQSMKRQ